jgi:hypothetical protein
MLKKAARHAQSDFTTVQSAVVSVNTSNASSRNAPISRTDVSMRSALPATVNAWSHG